MRVELLGSVRVDGEVDTLSRRDRVALTALALHPDGVVSVDGIADAIWGEDQPASRVKVVQGCISRLRRRLGRDAIVTEGDGYRLALPDEEVDVHRFERLVERGRELLRIGEPDPAAHVLGEALSLWSDPRLGDLDDWDVGRIERQRLGELRESAEELRVDAVLRAGRPREALPTAVGLVEATPLRESRWVLLARAQYQCDRQADALATLERARAVLADELGLDAGRALASLQRQILQHDLALDVPEAEVASGHCPYPGLVPFEEEDAEQFFGRDEEIDECLARLRRDGVVVVVGPSGSGKSSLVRSGLAARCRREGRTVAVVVATDRLVAELDDASPRPDVLVVDQLEALTGPEVDTGCRRAALEAVVEHVYRGWTVLVVRGDRVGEFAAGPIAGLLERHMLLLGAMDARALREAVVGPADRAGLLIEPGLVDLLVHEVEHEPGALPLLAHALRATWHRREGRTLTVAGYRAAGGVRGAIAQTAETVHDALDETGRRRLRDLMLRMVLRSRDDTLVAVPVARQTAVEKVGHDALEQLAAARLIILEGDRVRLAHEALARAWPRMRAWLAEDVAGQRILRHLTVAAEAWDRLGRPDSELYRGVRLEEALAWHDRTTSGLTPVEAAFLDAATAHRDGQRAEEAERAARTLRTNRRLRRLLRAVAALSVVALLVGALAADNASRARDEALAADARRVGAQSLLTDRVDTSLLLAVAAVQLEDSPDTRASLLTALGRAPQLAEVVLPGDGGSLLSIAVDPAGGLLGVDEEAVGMRYVDRSTGHEVAVLRDGGGPVGIVDPIARRTAFHPAGGPVAHAFSSHGVPGPGSGSESRSSGSGSGGDGGPVVLLHPTTLEVVHRLEVDLGPTRRAALPLALAWSPDGSALAAVLELYAPTSYRPDEGLLVVWDVADDAPTARTTDEVALHSRSLAWSPDGRRLFTATDTTALGADPVPRTTVWDARRLAVEATLDGIGHPLDASPDDGRLAGLRHDPGRPPQVVLVDPADGTVHTRLEGTDERVRALRFSPDGTTIATASGRTTTIHDATTGHALESLGGHAATVTDIAFAADGDTLLTAGADGAALSWDLTGDRPLLAVETRATPGIGVRPLSHLPVHASISPDGSHVMYVGGALRETFDNVSAAVQFLDVDTGRLTPVRTTSRTPWLIPLWTADGTPVTWDTGGRVTTWDPTTGEEVQRTWTQMFSSLVGLAGEETVVLSDTISAVFRLGDDGFAAPPVGLSSLEQAAGLEFAQLSLRPLPTSTDGHLVVALAGRDRSLDRSLRPSAREPYLFDELPASDHLVVLDLRDMTDTTVVDLGFDGAAAAIAPDGRRVAVTGRRGEVGLVDLRTAHLVAPPAIGHEGHGRSVAWTDDGRIVATAGEDGRVALWDGRSAAPLGSLPVASPGTIPYVATGRDTAVVVATTDGEVLSLDTRLESWIDTACAVADRSLTLAEWRAVAGARDRPATCDGV